MRTVRIVQAVSVILIAAIASSCAASKQYTSKLFAPRTPVIKDSQAVALRFLETDSAGQEQEGWVSTDIIMGRDTVSKTLALDRLANDVPVSGAKTATAAKQEQSGSSPVVQETKPIPMESKPVAINAKPGEVRTKKTRE
jgi:hypothetical protein